MSEEKMSDATIAERNLTTAVQMELQRVLMERELDLDQFERLEQMLRGAKELLTALAPREYVVGPLPTSDELAEKIQAERFKTLGFTQEQMRRRLLNNPLRDHYNQQSTEALIRLAEAQGVGEDDEDEEVEEVVVRQVDPLRDREVWMPIGLVDKVIYVLGGSDGDVVDHLIDMVNDCRTRHEIVNPDDILPIDVGLVQLIAFGLADVAVLAEHPQARELADEVSKCVLKAAGAKNEETFKNHPGVANTLVEAFIGKETPNAN